MSYLGGCFNLEEQYPKMKGKCCGSCHDDEEYSPGSAYSEIETSDGYYEVCCLHHERWKKPYKEVVN